MTLGAVAAARRRTVHTDYTVPATNLRNRWRADSIAQADNTAVASWPNLNGGVDLAQATSGDRPTYRTGRQNGKPAVAWPTSAGGTVHLLSTAFATQAQPVTFVGILKPSDISNMEFFHWGGTAEMYIESSKWNSWTGASSIASAGAPTPNAWVVWTFVVNGASSAMYINGTQVATGNAGSLSLGTTLNFGRHASTAGRNWRGDIGEFIVYTDAADATKRAQIHSYVQDYWGITVADYLG